MGQNSTERGDLQGQQGVVRTGRPEVVTPPAPTSNNPAAGWTEIEGGEAAKPGQSKDNELESVKD